LPSTAELSGTRGPLPDGLSQLDTYLAQLSLDTGTLVIFDRRRGCAGRRAELCEHTPLCDS
jgi:hypothetical protein